MSLIPDSAQRAFRHALLGCFAAGWNGGISALAAILGIDAVALSGVDTVVASGNTARVLNAHEMGAAFCGAFVIHAIMWLKTHPMPETISDTNPSFPVQPPKP